MKENLSNEDAEKRVAIYILNLRKLYLWRVVLSGVRLLVSLVAGSVLSHPGILAVSAGGHRVRRRIPNGSRQSGMKVTVIVLVHIFTLRVCIQTNARRRRESVWFAYRRTEWSASRNLHCIVTIERQKKMIAAWSECDTRITWTIIT